MSTILLNKINHNVINAAKAWINFYPSSSPTIRDSHNISSIVLISEGRYRINFTIPFNNSNYVVVGSGQRNGINGDFKVSIIGSDPSYPNPENNMTSTFVNIETGFNSQSWAAYGFMASVVIFGS